MSLLSGCMLMADKAQLDWLSSISPLTFPVFTLTVCKKKQPSGARIQKEGQRNRQPSHSGSHRLTGSSAWCDSACSVFQTFWTINLLVPASWMELWEDLPDNDKFPKNILRQRWVFCIVEPYRLINGMWNRGLRLSKHLSHSGACEAS